MRCAESRPLRLFVSPPASWLPSISGEPSAFFSRGNSEMGTRTGLPRGRPKGSKNKRTVEREVAMQKAAQAITAAIPEAFEGDAHALLMATYKDTALPLPTRLDAAKAAIGYEKPRL